MVEGERSQALDAIHYEALKLAMRDDLPEGAQDGLDLSNHLDLISQAGCTHHERKAGRR